LEKKEGIEGIERSEETKGIERSEETKERLRFLRIDKITNCFQEIGKVLQGKK